MSDIIAPGTAGRPRVGVLGSARIPPGDARYERAVRLGGALASAGYTVVTGGYGDGNCADEHLWAAAELGRATGDGEYEKYFVENYGDFRNSVRAIGPQSWGNVANLALWTYALGHGKNAEAAASIRETSLKAADEIVTRTAAAGYRNSMTTRDYIWGSNSVTDRILL